MSVNERKYRRIDESIYAAFLLKQLPRAVAFSFSFNESIKRNGEKT